VTSTQPIRVFVVDDQALVRAGFRMILEAEPDLVVAGEAADGEQAVARIAADPPDVVLMDVRMPGVDGIEATRRIRGAPELAGVRVIMLTTFDMDEYVYDALRAGASGFVLKDLPPEQLIDGIRGVHTGSSLLSPSITRRIIEVYLDRPAAGPPPRGVDTLTPREREILGLLGRGLSNAEIADDLVVSETTVKTHVGRVLMKLDLRDRVQAVIFAYESGVVAIGHHPPGGR
jgi:DNA-binding NarL/FixJ family response regulator